MMLVFGIHSEVIGLSLSPSVRLTFEEIAKCIMIPLLKDGDLRNNLI